MTDKPEVSIRLTWPQAYVVMKALRDFKKRARGNRELEKVHKSTMDAVVKATEETFRNQDPLEVGNA
jgi:hypothetical protein